jgi:hypothetical protein
MIEAVLEEDGASDAQQIILGGGHHVALKDVESQQQALPFGIQRRAQGVLDLARFLESCVLYRIDHWFVPFFAVWQRRSWR